MRLFFESLAVAFSMYTRIPMPQFAWNERNMRWSLAFLPVIGAMLALVLYGVFMLFHFLALGPFFFAAVATAIPVFLTGGLHFDGFCDVCDALAAHAGPADRLRIMKDSRVGAFGVIYIATVFLLQGGAWSQIYSRPHFLLPVLFAAIISRVLSPLSILYLPKANPEGLAAAFSGYAGKKGVTICLTAAFALAAVLPNLYMGAEGFCIPALMLVLWLFLNRLFKKQFGGITGDMAGCCMVVLETSALLFGAVFSTV